MEKKELGQKRIRLLIVDDDSLMLSTTKLMLTEMDNSLKVYSATSVDEALKKIKEDHPDIIVSDYEMPMKDGLEFLRLLRQEKTELPFIIFTGKGREEVAIQALNLGADGYYNKQGSPETVYGELLHGIRNAVDFSRTRKLIEQNEEHYKNTLNSMLEGCQIIGYDWRYLYLNTIAERQSKRQRMALLGYSFMDVWPGVERTDLFAAMERSMKNRTIEAMENLFVYPDGKAGWFKLQIVPIPEGIFILSEDITESKKTQEYQNALIQLLKISSQTAESKEMVKLIVDFFITHSGCEAVGIRLKNGEDYPYYEASGFPQEHIHFENSLCACDESGNLIRDSKGNPIIECMCGNIICGRFDSSKSFFTPQGSFWANDTTRLLALTTDADRQAKTRNRCNGEGYESVALIPLRVASKCIGLIQLNDKRKNMFSLEKIQQLENLADYVALAFSKAITEEVLLESQKRYQKAQEMAQVGNWEIDLKRKTIWASDEAFRIYGLERTSNNYLPLSTAQKLVLPEYRPMMDLALDNLISNNKQYDYEFKIRNARNGEERFLHSKAELLYDEFHIPIRVAGVVQDTTERRVAEDLLRFSEEKHRSLVENARDIICTHDLQGKIITINNVVEEYGFEKKQVIGKSLLEFVNEESKRQLSIHFENLAKGQFVQGEAEITIPIGRIHVEYKSNPILQNGTITGVQTIIRDVSERKKAQATVEKAYGILEKVGEGIDAGLAVIDRNYKVTWANRTLRSVGISADKKCYQIFNNLDHVCPDCGVRAVFEKNVDLDVHEYCFIDQKGEKVWVELRVSPLKDREGKVTSAIELAVPITERKRKEEQIISQQAKLSIVNEKLHVVGSLTRHDVANKLQVAKTNAYLLKKRLKDQQELLRFVDAMDLAINQSCKIFDYGRYYEKIGSEELMPINVAESFDQAVSLIVHSGVKIANNLSGLEILADSMLRQLFYTLLDNSLKHGKTVTKIEVYYTENENQTTINYADNGVGIPEEAKEKIFCGNFTTDGGSGTGLRVVKRMVEVYGWAIKENGAPGKGTNFEIIIPKRSCN
jgi:PAS domain S-box-containing protein